MGPVGATRSGGCGTRLPEGWAAQLTSQKSSYWGARVPVAIGRIGLMTPSASLPRKMAVVLGAETFVVIVLLALAGSDLPPPVGFVVMIPVGLLLGVAVGAATVPLLRRIDREGAVRALLTSVLGGAAIGAGTGLVLLLAGLAMDTQVTLKAAPLALWFAVLTAMGALSGGSLGLLLVLADRVRRGEAARFAAAALPGLFVIVALIVIIVLRLTG